MIFSTKLIKLRKSRGLSQEDLANEINVTRQTISKWELGTTIPDMEKLKLISNYFGVSVDELISENKSSENEQVNNKEFIGVDEKYIPKQNLNDINQNYVDKNKKSNKIFLIALLPICIVAIISVIIISMVVKSMNNFNNTKMEIVKEFEEEKDTKKKEFEEEKDTKKKEFENYKNNIVKEFEEKKDTINEIMNTQNERIDSGRQELENSIKEFYETQESNKNTINSLEQKFENFKNSVN